jgi:hypothetical protein
VLNKPAPLPVTRRRAVFAALLASVGMLFAMAVVAPARAAEPVPFTIEEQIDFDAGVFTFTATEPFCPSGTFEDDVTVAAFPHSDQAQSGGFNLVIRTTYTCDDGSGTFDALKHVFITIADDGFTNADHRRHGGLRRHRRPRGERRCHGRNDRLGRRHHHRICTRAAVSDCGRIGRAAVGSPSPDAARINRPREAQGQLAASGRRSRRGSETAAFACLRYSV